jgi:hypothetical protein
VSLRTSYGPAGILVIVIETDAGGRLELLSRFAFGGRKRASPEGLSRVVKGLDAEERLQVIVSFLVRLEL